MRQVGLYPEQHPLTVEALNTAVDAGDEVMTHDSASEFVITILDSAFYHNRTALAHTSLEQHDVLREMQERGISSVRVMRPLSGSDLYDLAAFIVGVADDLPADGTVKLNDSTLTLADVGETPLSGLRGSYRSSLDALRSVTGSMMVGGGFELTTVVEAVESLFESTVADSSAALLLSTVKSHDQYTYYHSVNACMLALATGRMLGIDKDDLISIGVGAVLHDIGKVTVSPTVLNYPGRLDSDQWKEITYHPQEGALAIMAAGGDRHQIAATVALEHHSRFDGGGYPSTSRTERPHVYSRMVSVVDVYDALTTRRAYRRAETPNQALQVILKDAGAHFDPDVVRVFIGMMGIYPPGSLLELTDGMKALVVERVEPGEPLSGLLVVDSVGHELVEPVPVEIDPTTVARQLLPSHLGIDPAAMVDYIA
jgi:HD-GYP domain-containing protein (c-di-GMP phosphodiesterase class II)